MALLDRLRAHPANAAAIANALVVLLGPFLLLLSMALLPERQSDTSVTVRAPGGPDYAVILRGIVLPMLSVLTPAALLTAWRTWVLARRWIAGQRGDWRGVLEAGACGFGWALLGLAPGILTRPAEAPPYVIAYGGMALILGLVVGLVLRTSALIVLRALDAEPLGYP